MSVSVWEEKSKRDIDQATEKIVKLIQSYTGVVNKMVWRKF